MAIQDEEEDEEVAAEGTHSMKNLKSSGAKKNLAQAESDEDDYSPYKMEKSQEEILA